MDAHLQFHMSLLRTKLEAVINMTPTGPIRNELCDANIHVERAILLQQQPLTRAGPKPIPFYESPDDPFIAHCPHTKD